jgi:signal transduction histidine kinase
MKFNSKAIITILFAYIIAQFLWWEVLLVRQLNQLINEKQKILELSISDEVNLRTEIETLNKSRINKSIMIVGEGTIFLFLLLFGINKIRKANKRELELLNQKNNFLLSITHELKTPLATMKLQLQTLEKHKLEQSKQQELIKIALSENKRLNGLIDNILLAANMQHNNYNINKEPVNLSEFVLELLNTNFKNELETKKLIPEIAPGISCSIDKIAFPSVINNLIENAIKYSPEEILVTFKMYIENNKVIIQVIDRGIGISDNEKESIFEQFYRSGNEEIRKTKGTGLGLFIVKYIVLKHGGKITVKDNLPKGSVFEIELNTV